MWILLIIFLLCLSIFLSIKLKFKNYKLDIKNIFSNNKTSLFLTLGTKMGVGSLIGTSSAILLGGFSSIIWIILFSLLFTSLIYFEAYYGNKYKKLYKDSYIGGPNFIIKYGLNNKILSVISLIILIFLYSFFTQSIQFNTISYILINDLKIPLYLIIIISIVILIITINLSVKEVLNILNKLVPYMCLIFVLVCAYLIIKNIKLLNISIFLKDLTSFKSIFSGFVIGFKRCIFMNEILIGTTSIGSSSDDNDINTSIKYQILSLYFISIVMTIIIACLLIIYIDCNTIYITDYNLLMSNIFEFLMGKSGSYFLLIIYILFGITTILSGYYIGLSNIEYFFNNKYYVITFKALFMLFCLLGIVLNNFFIWKFLDILIFIMIVINSYSIIKLVIKYDW